MLIIEIESLPNGAHRNQSGNFAEIPEGWVEVPEGMELPKTFPFVEVIIGRKGKLTLKPISEEK